MLEGSGRILILKTLKTIELMPYPEHEKLKKREADHTLICEFFSYLDDLDLVKGGRKPDDVIAGFFGIDIDAFHREKEVMYQSLRSANERTDD